MKGFVQPDYGNAKRVGSPVNSARNLQRKLNRQARGGSFEFEASLNFFRKLAKGRK